jgi:hypothetical protein
VDEVVLNVGTAIFALGMFAELLFALDYGITAPWWRSWIGVMFMLNALSIICAGSSILLSRVLGPHYWGRPFITLLTFSLFSGAAIMRYGVYLHERGRPVSELPVPSPTAFPEPVRRRTRREQRAARRAELSELRGKRSP